ncbi:MAG: hypothetical protein V4629_13675 [Pseudomonadota bacterium]
MSSLSLVKNIHDNAQLYNYDNKLGGKLVYRADQPESFALKGADATDLKKIKIIIPAGKKVTVTFTMYKNEGQQTVQLQYINDTEEESVTRLYLNETKDNTIALRPKKLGDNLQTPQSTVIPLHESLNQPKIFKLSDDTVQNVGFYKRSANPNSLSYEPFKNNSNYKDKTSREDDSRKDAVLKNASPYDTDKTSTNTSPNLSQSSSPVPISPLSQNRSQALSASSNSSSSVENFSISSVDTAKANHAVGKKDSSKSAKHIQNEIFNAATKKIQDLIKADAAHNHVINKRLDFIKSLSLKFQFRGRWLVNMGFVLPALIGIGFLAATIASGGSFPVIAVVVAFAVYGLGLIKGIIDPLFMGYLGWPSRKHKDETIILPNLEMFSKEEFQGHISFLENSMINKTTLNHLPFILSKKDDTYIYKPISDLNQTKDMYQKYVEKLMIAQWIIDNSQIITSDSKNQKTHFETTNHIFGKNIAQYSMKNLKNFLFTSEIKSEVISPILGEKTLHYLHDQKVINISRYYQSKILEDTSVKHVSIVLKNKKALKEFEAGSKESLDIKSLSFDLKERLELYNWANNLVSAHNLVVEKRTSTVIDNNVVMINSDSLHNRSVKNLKNKILSLQNMNKDVSKLISALDQGFSSLRKNSSLNYKIEIKIYKILSEFNPLNLEKSLHLFNSNTGDLIVEISESYKKLQDQADILTSGYSNPAFSFPARRPKLTEELGHDIQKNLENLTAIAEKLLAKLNN